MHLDSYIYIYIYIYIYVLVENFDQAEKFKIYLNKKHKNISFTLELEENNKLSFLDIDVQRCDTSISFMTSIYRKPTFSGMYTNFKSFVSIKYKYALTSPLLFRVLSTNTRSLLRYYLGY